MPSGRARARQHVGGAEIVDAAGHRRGAQCGEPYFEAREVLMIQRALTAIDEQTSALAGKTPSE